MQNQPKDYQAIFIERMTERCKDLMFPSESIGVVFSNCYFLAFEFESPVTVGLGIADMEMIANVEIKELGIVLTERLMGIVSRRSMKDLGMGSMEYIDLHKELSAMQIAYNAIVQPIEQEIAGQLRKEAETDARKQSVKDNILTPNKRIPIGNA